jgi:hypothetical protein
LIGHLEGALTEAMLNTLGCVFVGALLNLLESGVIFGFKRVSVIVANVEGLP